MKVQPLFTNYEDININNYMEKYNIKDFNTYKKGNTLEDCKYYDNIFLWCTELNKSIINNQKLYLLVDCDMDGYLSSSMFYSYYKEVNRNIDIIPMYHKKKTHGLSDNEIMDYLLSVTPSCLIILDAGTNDTKECQVLKDKGWSILVADHHKQEIQNPYCILINNQISVNVTNKGLSGTGVTWKILRVYDNMFHLNYSNKYISYVFISIISDSMDIRYYENYSFIKWGKLNIHKNLKPFVEILNKGDTNKDYSFGLIPCCNSLIRLGSLEDKNNLFRAFCGELNNTESIISRCKTLHNKQSVQIKKIIDSDLIQIINLKKVILARIDIDSPLTGLIANKLMSKYNQPIILVHSNNIDGKEVYMGSARSPLYFDLKTFLLNSNLFEFCQGHSYAFGLAYDKTKEQDIISYLNTADIPSEATETVLISDELNYIPNDVFAFVEQYRQYFGNGIPIPLIHIKPFLIYNMDIRIMGKSNNVIKFHKFGIDFLMFFVNQEIKNKLFLEDNQNIPLKVELIGEPSINYFRNTKTMQCIINKIEIHKEEL